MSMQSSSKNKSTTTLNVYRSYAFKDKDPVIDRVRTMIEDEGVSYTKIHEASGVSTSTLHNWFNGPTKRPQYSTVAAVVGSQGYELAFVKTRRVINGKMIQAEAPVIISNNRYGKRA